MAAVDACASDKVPDLSRVAVRYIDDVTIYASSEMQALDLVAKYADSLSEYELTLNSHKTTHLNRVDSFDPPWYSVVRTQIARIRRTTTKSGLISIFSPLLEIAEGRDRASALRYFLTAIPKTVITPELWDIFQDFLMIAIRIDSIAISHAHQHLVRAKSGGAMKRFGQLEENLSDFLEEACKAGHAFETAAALNLLTDMGTVVDDDLARRASSLESDMVDLLLVEASGKAKRLRHVRREIENRGLAQDAFSSGHWMLAYETQRSRPSQQTAEFRAGEWAALAKADVSFIRDPSSSPRSRWYLTRLAARTHRNAYSARTMLSGGSVP
jgi:hypothetical protein